jgi:hypothetical protein
MGEAVAPVATWGPDEKQHPGPKGVRGTSRRGAAPIVSRDRLVPEAMARLHTGIVQSQGRRTNLAQAAGLVVLFRQHVVAVRYPAPAVGFLCTYRLATNALPLCYSAGLSLCFHQLNSRSGCGHRPKRKQPRRAPTVRSAKHTSTNGLTIRCQAIARAPLAKRRLQPGSANH